MRRSLYVFWKFTRPHTIIGSAVSVSALYLLSLHFGSQSVWVFIGALASALLCNIFITGYNQINDVDLDKINKPYLPIAAGELHIGHARIIVYVALSLSLIIAAILSLYFFLLIALISGLGFIYSWKSVFLKRRHESAAIAITAVRGILVNIGFFAFFTSMAISEIPASIWLLTGFTTIFSIGIAWFKDIPDVSGDTEHRIGTMASLQGVEKTFHRGVILIAVAYSVAAVLPLLLPMSVMNNGVLTLGHGFLGLFFLWRTRNTDPSDRESISRFYGSYWVLFFAEYLLFVLAAFW